MAGVSTPLYDPRFVLNMHFKRKAVREKIKTDWRSQQANTMILTALIKFEEKYSEARVPVRIEIVPGPSVTLDKAQSNEIFELLVAWLHPPGDIHLSSGTRRDMQRACIKRALGQNRPYTVVCSDVVKEGYVINVQLINAKDERYHISFTLKAYGQGGRDTRSVDYDDEGAEQEGSNNAQDADAKTRSADADADDAKEASEESQI